MHELTFLVLKYPEATGHIYWIPDFCYQDPGKQRHQIIYPSWMQEGSNLDGAKIVRSLLDLLCPRFDPD